jgi:glucose-1-phosphate cytidylyltransferase
MYPGVKGEAPIMQVVILAGGYGTRLAEETDLIPKPLVRIGSEPILFHIMKYYASFGHKEFVIALGYKAEVVVEYFNSAVDVKRLGWQVKLVDTGLDTSTGGRIKKLEDYLDSSFLLTYGDGLSNINLELLLKLHHSKGKIATVTAVHPPVRFGSLLLAGDFVLKFAEKDPQDAGWINGGYFCFEKEVLNFLPDYETPLEGKPLDILAQNGELVAYKHEGWWQPMDSLRDKRILNGLLQSGTPPWER